ncbi:phage tail protein [Budviciaceae bacterium CWB-B4]|uniref:Phage tail protein n=1 Tax=Limnobaculum xujianqingii TaxID=2738837 RepID=A0A9D7AGD6_9GAMM|nr:phage tail protein [Limnobaculum xujianqingii]MBK5175540.1 phage tail protein [Limnobaculum xujianqingii]
MTTQSTTEPVKGAGTTFWSFSGTGDPVEQLRADEAWTRLAKVKELTPGELSAESEDDTYLDDDDADWSQTAQGEKSAGETNVTLAWKPGEPGQQKLVEWFQSGDVLYYKIQYPNGAIDLFRGWVSGLGKSVVAKERITRTVKITNTGRPPVLAEEDLSTAAPESQLLKVKMPVVETTETLPKTSK